MTKWHVAAGVVVVLGISVVIDWIDGPDQHPDPYVIYGLMVIAGLAFGMRPPWGGGKGE